ncbi:hypothetical protein DFH09DRAFT_1365415 [Mycena vulgaris]|nr:hypothetical protein DFH09DRAFT_1365415 [Mycena vulgaris]
MYRGLSGRASDKESYRSAASTSPSSTLEDHAERLINSAPTLLRKSRAAPNKSAMNSSKSLRHLSWILHSALVVMHLTLIAIWAKRLENRVVFGLQHQNTVSFLLTAITQTLGTIYLAVLVLVTQKLSLRRSLITNQPLTVTHDSTAAWAGIGSAVLYIWHQKAVRASVAGVLSVFLYLGGILVLHITTPALFSLETFNSTSFSIVRTKGRPTIDLSGYNITTVQDINNLPEYASFSLTDYVTESLEYLPFVDGSTHIGLEGMTLYDVPETNTGIGNITVAATGFNISCGFLEDVQAKLNADNNSWSLQSGGGDVGQVDSIELPGAISMASRRGMFFSITPIIDSSNNTGGFVQLSPPMIPRISSIQLFQCSLSLVEQTAIVDAQSKNVVALHPELTKTHSTWLPASLEEPVETTGNTLIDEWGYWYSLAPASFVPRTPSGPTFLSNAELYLMLNLQPANESHVMTLHDLDNVLSVLTATIVWTLGYVPPKHQLNITELFLGNWFNDPHVKVESPISLPPGKEATTTEQFTAIRLDLSAIALSIGLIASIALMLLSLQHLLHPGDEKAEQDVPIDGTGLLHAIWLYRNHPELEVLLEQVERPTDDNLRDAGIVRTRLVGPTLSKTESQETLANITDGSV